MSDRGNNKPLKLSLASNRSARSPLTPRLAGNATASTITAKPAAPRAPSKTRILPKVKSQDLSSARDAPTNGNITPRSAARISRVESPQASPSQGATAGVARPRSIVGISNLVASSSGNSSVVGVSGKARAGRPMSVIGDGSSTRATHTPLVRSPGLADLHRNTPDESIDNRFFHASDVSKQDPAPKKVEPKKTAAFFYADGQEDRLSGPPRTTSPVLSAISEKRLSGPWIRSDPQSHPSNAPPMLSPPLSALSGSSPYFAAATSPHRQARSPSPSKENIHLSYRKGASQIFGTRAIPRSSATSVVEDSTPIAVSERRRRSLVPPHRKSTSLSSIDSGNSPRLRGRSTTEADNVPNTGERQTIKLPLVASPTSELPSIDTSLHHTNTLRSAPEAAFSPTKAATDLATDARRERKVLDLEISNSSLLAINSSLEREMRRQKAELKRFRRLSRAGRLSSVPYERSARFSEGLSTLGEGEEDDELDGFGPPSGLTDLYDDMSESEDESSLLSGSEPLSPATQASREQDRLVKDEKRLRIDLEKHKELLVQSQMMNQSLKRCMYATEEMISEGKKALNYNVRVSDVKLGGRILTGNEEDDDVAREVEVDDGDIQSAKGLLDVWAGLGQPNFEGSEGSGDRDSGIEIDKPPSSLSNGLPYNLMRGRDYGRPPDVSFARAGDARRQADTGLGKVSAPGES